MPEDAMQSDPHRAIHSFFRLKYIFSNSSCYFTMLGSKHSQISSPRLPQYRLRLIGFVARRPSHRRRHLLLRGRRGGYRIVAP